MSDSYATSTTQTTLLNTVNRVNKVITNDTITDQSSSIMNKSRISHKNVDTKSLQRKQSFNKLLNTYNRCAQNIFFLPNLLTWLKTSILQNYIEKLIFQLKSIALKCTIYLSLMFKIDFDCKALAIQILDVIKLKRIFFYSNRSTQTETNVTFYIPTETRSKKDEFLSKNNHHQVQISKFNCIILKCLVYFSLIFVYLQMSLLLYTLCLCEIPIGMAFLLCAGLAIVILGFFITYTTTASLMKNADQQKKQKTERVQTKQPPSSIQTRSKYFFMEKTISKIKLF